MNRLGILILIVFLLLAVPFASYADQGIGNEEFSALFENHGAVMLLIDPNDGAIVDANKAATEFYGHDKSKLLSMNISEINVLSDEQVNQEMEWAVKQKRNSFFFQHKLADGSVRFVDVYSYPVHIKDKDLLFSIVHDVTNEVQVQKQHEDQEKQIYMSGMLIIILLTAIMAIIIRNGRKLKKAKDLLDNMNALRETFINADRRLIYLKDENLNYTFVNHALEEFYQKSSEEIIGRNDFDLSDRESAEQRKRTDLEVIQTGELIIDEERWDGNIYEVTKFPIKLPNGKYGIGAYKRDITEERIMENKQKRVLLRHMILVDILTREFQSKAEHMDYVLHKALELTASQYGYIYFYNEETHEFQLNSWSKGVMKDCEVVEKMTKYQLENTGFWGEVVRQRKPIIENRFGMENPFKKGYPEGHVPLERFMSVPIFIDEKIMGVIGLANKDTDYDYDDQYEITILMNSVWNEMMRKDAQQQLSIERKKYLQTLVSIGDGVLVVDCSGNIEMLNPIAEHLTGWTIDTAKGRNYKEVFQLSHSAEGMEIQDPIEQVFKTYAVCEMENHAIITSRGGIRYHIEDSAAPIKDDHGNTIGVVLVFRNVTERKEQQEKIEYMSFHDALTGLYNRRFFEEELHRIDVARNLPISIIMGDANGLKIANDIFGHAYGDILLRTIAEVMERVCRSDDIIARWGGDEFVILLPNTEETEASLIVERIEAELTQKEIRAIKASASFGYDTKKNTAESLVEVLDRAEGKMYRNKTLGREGFKRSTLESIINKLHEMEPEERAHSENISKISSRIGQKLGIEDKELNDLNMAGYLHDIGKMIFEAGTHESGKKDFGDREKHTLIGYRIMSSFGSQDMAEITLSHHEQWDGKGYPRGLTGEEIPLFARIVAAAEYYCSLEAASENVTDDSFDYMINAIKSASGSVLDPYIAEALIEILNENKNRISLVKEDTE